MNWFPSGLSLFLEGEPWTVVSPRGRGGGVFYLCNVVSIIIQWWEGNKGKGAVALGASDRGEKY